MSLRGCFVFQGKALDLRIRTHDWIQALERPVQVFLGELRKGCKL